MTVTVLSNSTKTCAVTRDASANGNKPRDTKQLVLGCPSKAVPVPSQYTNPWHRGYLARFTVLGACWQITAATRRRRLLPTADPQARSVLEGRCSMGALLLVDFKAVLHRSIKYTRPWVTRRAAQPFRSLRRVQVLPDLRPALIHSRIKMPNEEPKSPLLPWWASLPSAIRYLGESRRVSSLF